MARRTKFQELPEENWGQRVHRAYRQQRDRTGRKYMDVAALISKVMPVYDTTLQRLEKYERAEDLTTRQRINAWLVLLAYGFNPEEFGITKDMVPVERLTSKEVVDLLLQQSRCFTTSAA